TGGFEFRIYAPEKAHSHTDIMIEVVNDSVLFLGDNVTAKRFGRMDDGTFRGNSQACERALGIQAKYYIPGHGKTGNHQIVTEYKNYLDIVYTEVSRLYEQGMSDFEMKPLILKKLQNYQSWSGFEEEYGRHLSMAVLEVEKAQFE
ncbi:MAG: MBL fold metallo-hydrolase, partial [Gammaproteobacteria bacterium]|nr:MBL fold metallo-hydrolase [Gammaproteobacteria bacterium]